MKGRKHKASGGMMESGRKDWEEDLKSRPARYNESKVENEAEERKGGGKVMGKKAKHHAGRKPRKSGGRATGASPFSAAHSGTPAKGHKAECN